MLKVVFPVRSVPWSPHIGFLIGLLMTPRSITGLVQCIPKALPIVEFNIAWKTLSDDMRSVLWRKANKRASQILFKQKMKPDERGQDVA